MFSADLKDEEKRAAALVANGGSPDAVEVARDSMKLQAEVRRLERILMREPEIGSFHQDEDGAAALEVTGDHMIAILFQELSQQLHRSGAVNRLTMKGYSPKSGLIEVVIQRVGRLTPEDARIRAEQHLGRAVKLLADHGIAWDGPTAFPPDDAITDGVPEDARRPWLWLDFRQTPNVLLCKRCGGTQALPERATAAVFSAVHQAFGEQHAACEEGDADAESRRA